MESQPHKIEPGEPPHVKYVFVDIVGFTKNRSVEAQSFVVGALNGIIHRALEDCQVETKARILIPTGDGVAIALIDLGPYDLHMRLALSIIHHVHNHNSAMEHAMRKFAVRLGVNQNEDNLISDINGAVNVAGRGISLAQRIMDKADAGQILVGRAVYETLIQRERYMKNFRQFETTDKHGEQISVYQYLSDNQPTLNVEIPSAFAEKKVIKPKLTKTVAYYMAHAYRNREYLLSRKEAGGMRDYAGPVLLYFLAEDSRAKSEASPHKSPTLKAWSWDCVI